jgi:hypothetical protein
MRPSSLHLLLAGSCVLLVACSSAPSISLKSGPLVVGQQVSIRVTEGGDGSDLKEDSLVLRDPALTLWGAAELGATKLKPGEVAFQIPRGIVAGDGVLDVTTQKGARFRGTVPLRRMISVRDGNGDVWLPVIDSEGHASPQVNLRAQQTGFGSGYLAVSPAGSVLAVAARSDKELRLVRLGTSPKISPAASLPDFPRDVVITQSGATLVATDQGVFVAAPPTSFGEPPVLAAEPFLATPALSLARDSRGAQAVALVRDGTPPTYALVLIDLTASPPTAASPVSLGWPADVPVPFRLAISDGGAVLVVNRPRDTVALLPARGSAIVEQAMPAGQNGPVAVCASLGDLFFVVNAGYRNVSQVSTGSGAPVFGPPIEFALPDASGLPVAIAASDREEVVVLFEHDVVLITGPDRTVAVPQLGALFADKTTQLGVALAIQP